MKKYLSKIIFGLVILSGIAGAVSAMPAEAVTCTNTFPGSLNNYAPTNCIPSAWANALEAKLGIDMSSATTSIDYLLNNLFTSYKSDIIKATSTQGLLQTLNNLSDLLSTSTARTNLGLGNLATQNAPSAGIVTSNGTTLSSVATPLPVANGGTATGTAPTDSQFLSANGSIPTWKAIVSGTGLSISTSTTSSTITLNINGGSVQTCSNSQVVNGLSSTGTIQCFVTINTIDGVNTSTITLSGTANEINIATTTNSITLSTPQAIGTASSPTFASLTLTGNVSSTETSQLIYATSTGAWQGLTIGTNLTVVGGALNAVTSGSSTITINGNLNYAFSLTGSGNVTSTTTGSSTIFSLAPSGVASGTYWRANITVSSSGVITAANSVNAVAGTNITITTSTTSETINANAGGTTGDIQYNSSGIFSADSGNFTYGITTKQLSLSTPSSSVIIGSSTSQFIYNNATQTVAFAETGAIASWTVPTAITSITVNAIGAKGASGSGNTGGVGGAPSVVTSTFTVTPGQVLWINVGGQAGYNGGGSPTGGNSAEGGTGGGFTILETSSTLTNTSTVLLIAAGGGGGAGGQNAGSGPGGYGNLPTGGSGQVGSCTTAATGGTQSAGGTAGTCSGGSNGVNGSLFQGATTGVAENWGGGGGGGGYYGGAGGGSAVGANGNGGDGGGGSSFIGLGATGTSTATSSVATNGSLQIQYKGLIDINSSAYSLAVGGHILTGESNVPVVSSCGTGATISGNDTAGMVNTGASISACTITFATPWQTAPVCTVSDNQTASTEDISSITTSTLNMAFSTSISSKIIWYICLGY